MKKFLAGLLCTTMLLGATSTTAYSLELEDIDGSTYQGRLAAANALLDDLPPIPESYKTGYSAQAAGLSDQIVGRETNDYKKAKLLYIWTAKTIDYGDGRNPFEGHVGVCQDFAAVFSTLCWDQGIPCYIVYGDAYDEDKPIGSHAWNLFYANGSWHWADATEDRKLVDKNQPPFYFDTSTTILAEHHSTWGTYDFYKSSSWSSDSIMQAYAYNLVDDKCAESWTSSKLVTIIGQFPCRRKEFAQLATNLLEVYYDQDIDSIMADRGVTVGSFTDTDDPDVLAASALGIVSGYNGQFSPDNYITRQEAAAILMRTAKLLGLDDKTANITGFADYGQISTWARDSVAYCVAHDIMSGTSATTFAPSDNYSTEQCVVTILRLYEAAMA